MGALIFDMDGVLIDGEPLHFTAARTILAQEGADLDLDTYQGYIGKTADFIWPDMQARFGLRISRDEYSRRYDALVLEQYRTQSQAMPGARALLQRVGDAGLPTALASSSRRGWVDAALDAMDMRSFFHVIVTGDEVQRGKPDPEIYLTAAAKLNHDPGHCLVIEDAPAGIDSARGAGMRVVAVRTAMTAGLPLEGAERIIDSLDDFDLDWVREGCRT
ncbi:MAG: HAD family phosphatase [Dehalococcoidia bacterium]